MTTAQKWLLNGALFATLIALNLIYNAISTANPIVSGDAGTVLYATTFDSHPEEWERYEGRVSANIADGKLTLAINNTQTTAYSLTTAHYADFDVSVQAQPIRGTIDNGYGIVFRLSKPQTTCTAPLRILCDMQALPLFNVVLPLLYRPSSSGATGYYLFLISSDGYYSVWKAQDQNGTVISEKVSTWIASDAIKLDLNATNTVRVVAIGDTFRFFINGTPVDLCLPNDTNGTSTFVGGECIDGTMRDTWQDASYASGQIGVVAQNPSDDSAGVTVTFDNILIQMPTPSQEQ